MGLQVKDAVSDGQASANPMPLFSSGREVLPALGLAWANCANTCLFLSRQTAAADSPAVSHVAVDGNEQATVIQRALQARPVLGKAQQSSCADPLACVTGPDVRGAFAYAAAALAHVPRARLDSARHNLTLCSCCCRWCSALTCPMCGATCSWAWLAFGASMHMNRLSRHSQHLRCALCWCACFVCGSSRHRMLSISNV